MLEGLYESLITNRLQAMLAEVTGLTPSMGSVDNAEVESMDVVYDEAPLLSVAS